MTRYEDMTISSDSKKKLSRFSFFNFMIRSFVVLTVMKVGVASFEIIILT